MKRQDIQLDQVYSDGKLGLRQIIEQGPHLKSYSEQEDDDCVRYRVLHARQGETWFSKAGPEREHNSTVTSFASWAKALVPADQVEATLHKLIASCAKISDAQSDLLLRLDTVQGENNQVVKLEGREKSAAKALVTKGFLIAPSGTDMARLSPTGRALVSRINTELGAAQDAETLIDNLTDLGQASTKPSARRPRM